MFNGWIIIFLVYDFVIIVQKINSNSISSGIILLGTSQETLSEEESSDPENLWKSLIDPICEPLESTKKIFHVSSEGLQGWEWDREPHCWNLTILKRTKSCFKLFREQYFSLNSLFKVLKRSDNNFDQTIESIKFLCEYSIHTLVVRDWILLLGSLHIKQSRKFSENWITKLVGLSIFISITTTSTGLWLTKKNSRKSIVRFVLIFCDSSILMESINFWLLEIWKRIDVLNISFEFTMLWSIILSRRREFVIIIVENLLVVKVQQDNRHQSSIFIICDSTSIVAFTSKIVNSIKRNSVWVFIDKQVKLKGTNSKIWLVELILDVPSQWTVKLSLLNVSMEETETEKHLSECFWNSTWLKPFSIWDRISRVWTKQIGL